MLSSDGERVMRQVVRSSTTVARSLGALIGKTQRAIARYAELQSYQAWSVCSFKSALQN